VVRHPIYASYLLIQSGYVLQSLSLRNLAVVTLRQRLRHRPRPGKE